MSIGADIGDKVGQLDNSTGGRPARFSSNAVPYLLSTADAFVILLSSYPGSIYSGTMKLVVYTFVPAGFVVLVPVAFLREPSLTGAMTLGAAAVGYAALAVAAFLIGMQRYRRG